MPEASGSEVAEEPDYSTFDNKNGLAEDMKFLASMPELCDVTFLVGSTKEPICAVKAVLAARSRVFQKMFYQAPSPQRKKDPPPRENKIRLFLKRSSEPLLNLQNAAQQPNQHHTVTIEEFEPDVFRQLIEYIHTGSVTLQPRTLLGLMNAADYYGLEQLRKACTGFVQCCITVDTVCALLASAERYIQYKCTKSLVQKVLEFVDEHGNEVLNLGSFTLLPEHVVRLILAREELRADEFTKFQAALMWSKKYCDGNQNQDLKNVIGNFLEYIQFHKIPANVLMREVNPLGLVPSETIMTALAYQADPNSVDPEKLSPPKVKHQDRSLSVQSSLQDLPYGSNTSLCLTASDEGSDEKQHSGKNSTAEQETREPQQWQKPRDEEEDLQRLIEQRSQFQQMRQEEELQRQQEEQQTNKQEAELRKQEMQEEFERRLKKKQQEELKRQSLEEESKKQEAEKEEDSSKTEQRIEELDKLQRKETLKKKEDAKEEKKRNESMKKKETQRKETIKKKEDAKEMQRKETIKKKEQKEDVKEMQRKETLKKKEQKEEMKELQRKETWNKKEQKEDAKELQRKETLKKKEQKEEAKEMQRKETLKKKEQKEDTKEKSKKKKQKKTEKEQEEEKLLPEQKIVDKDESLEQPDKEQPEKEKKEEEPEVKEKDEETIPPKEEVKSQQQLEEERQLQEQQKLLKQQEEEEQRRIREEKKLQLQLEELKIQWSQQQELLFERQELALEHEIQERRYEEQFETCQFQQLQLQLEGRKPEIENKLEQRQVAEKRRSKKRKEDRVEIRVHEAEPQTAPAEGVTGLYIRLVVRQEGRANLVWLLKTHKF